MNNVKKRLREEASKQEIHDLQKSILNSVDTSKVIVPESSSIRRSLFVSNIFATCSIATVCVLVGVGLGYAVKKNKTTNTNNHIIESSSQRDSSYDESSRQNDESNLENDIVVFKNYLDCAFTQDTYNMVSIAHSFDNVSFDEVTLGENKTMTPSEELALVNDLNNYIYNIEDMLGIVTKTTCAKEKNTNTLYSYDEVITVDSPYYDYYVYLTETGIEEKNIGEENYKMNSFIQGLITYDSKSYEYDGIKVYKNETTTFNMAIEFDDFKTTLEEIYKVDLNEFRYNFYDNDTNLLKSINVKQKLDKTNGNTKEIQYSNTYTQLVIKADGQTEGSILCEIKGRNNDSLTITKNGDTYQYKFKNSGNLY